MGGLIQICTARQPKGVGETAGCNVTGCDDATFVVVEVGGGSDYGNRLATSTSILRLCALHARVIRNQISTLCAEQPR